MASPPRRVRLATLAALASCCSTRPHAGPSLLRALRSPSGYVPITLIPTPNQKPLSHCSSAGVQ
jgi:hypothetical protein